MDNSAEGGLKRPGIITRLKLVNFLNHANTVIEFRSPFTFLTGPNGSGKSSIMAAMQFLFAIRHSKIDRGTKNTDLIRYGEDFAEVTAEIVGHDGEMCTVSRKITKGGTTTTRRNGQKIDKQRLQEIYDDYGYKFDNPCVFLSQKVAKTLTKGTGKELHEFFYKATELHQKHQALIASAKDIDIKLKEIKAEWNSEMENKMQGLVEDIEKYKKILLEKEKAYKMLEYRVKSHKIEVVRNLVLDASKRIKAIKEKMKNYDGTVKYYADLGVIKEREKEQKKILREEREIRKALEYKSSLSKLEEELRRIKAQGDLDSETLEKLKMEERNLLDDIRELRENRPAEPGKIYKECQKYKGRASLPLMHVVKVSDGPGGIIAQVLLYRYRNLVFVDQKLYKEMGASRLLKTFGESVRVVDYASPPLTLPDLRSKAEHRDVLDCITFNDPVYEYFFLNFFLREFDAVVKTDEREAMEASKTAQKVFYVGRRKTYMISSTVFSRTVLRVNTNYRMIPGQSPSVTVESWKKSIMKKEQKRREIKERIKDMERRRSTVENIMEKMERIRSNLNKINRPIPDPIPEGFEENVEKARKKVNKYKEKEEKLKRKLESSRKKYSKMQKEMAAGIKKYRRALEKLKQYVSEMDKDPIVGISADEYHNYRDALNVLKRRSATSSSLSLEEVREKLSALEAENDKLRRKKKASWKSVKMLEEQLIKKLEKFDEEERAIRGKVMRKFEKYMREEFGMDKAYLHFEQEAPKRGKGDYEGSERIRKFHLNDVRKLFFRYEKGGKVVQPSGGELSMMVTAFLMSMWTQTNSPLMFADELLVFLDKENGSKALEQVIKIVYKKLKDRQFIYAAPKKEDLDLHSLELDNISEFYQILNLGEMPNETERKIKTKRKIEK